MIDRGAPPPLILASASPRRARVLEMLGLPFTVRPARIPEERGEEEPSTYASRLAEEKVRAVAGESPESLVLGADTVVVLDGAVLEKPTDRDDAVAMLRALGGRSHTVLTAVALAAPGGFFAGTLERAEVRFRPLAPGDAEAYAETDEPMDKAGGYGIQGRGAALVDGVRGDYYTVVGLPVAALTGLLERAGWRYRFGADLEPVDRGSRGGSLEDPSTIGMRE